MMMLIKIDSLIIRGDWRWLLLSFIIIYKYLTYNYLIHNLLAFQRISKSKLLLKKNQTKNWFVSNQLGQIYQ